MNQTKKTIHYSYKFYKGGFYPIIKIQLKGPQGLLETEAYVDSGASTSLFHESTASDLGIDYTRGKIFNVMVGDGSFIPVYLHTIALKIGTVSFRAKIGFSAHLGADFNLLGQKDIFDRFIVTFNKRKKIVSFKPF